ncbi:MAG: hypothetical protein BWY01_01491 [Synergistetes bacterium ADurb.Bin155]|nr:MAG: hypothetical protein BWY01_01491 [Synergistetes bacterium ADurb.Bin155]
MSSTDRSVGNTIISQLGGNEFLFITGAQVVYFDDGVSFLFPMVARGRWNHIHIKLGADDLYHCTLRRFTRNHALKRKEEVRDGIYCEYLRKRVEEWTGLATTMSRVVGINIGSAI